MAIVRASDIDAQMGRHIDPKSVPTHIGGSQGAMEANFVAQSDHQIIDRGYGQKGATVVEGRGPRNDLFGSATIISVNDAPPLEAAHEPPPPKMPPMPEVPASRAQSSATAPAIFARLQAAAGPPKPVQPAQQPGPMGPATGTYQPPYQYPPAAPTLPPVPPAAAPRPASALELLAKLVPKKGS